MKNTQHATLQRFRKTPFLSMSIYHIIYKKEINQKVVYDV